ncbi:MAG: glutathione peroxidase [Pseudomonas sp.]|uniref:glutathione peroxidase n=1 Tax=Pseudomonas sp. TaxID=306 RepID=UPI003393224E
MNPLRPLLALLVLLGASTLQAAECPPLLQGELTQLRGKASIDLCERFAGKPLLVVNTASHCGFTPQFKGLEALYQRYRDQGFEVLGVPSDDFRQEAQDSDETAKVCFLNYGVTFSMTEPQVVGGADAIPLFRELAAQSEAPSWNFTKYVVDRQGRVLSRFGSKVKPDDPALIEAVEQAIASPP